jgi:molecular chaperone Hsp33
VSDYLVRAISKDGSFRVIAADVSDAANAAAEQQGMSAAVGDVFARLLTGTAIVRSTVNPNERVQITVSHDGPAGRLLVDSWPEGRLRGYAAVPDAEAGEAGVLGRSGRFMVHRARMTPGGEPYQSITPVLEGDIDKELELYLQESEQIAASLHLHARLGQDARWRARGVLIQILPEATHETLSALVQHLEGGASLDRIDQPLTPEALVAALLPPGHPIVIVAEEAPELRCDCSDGRVRTALTSLPELEVLEMLEEGKDIELACGYCGATYFVTPDALRQMALH